MRKGVVMRKLKKIYFTFCARNFMWSPVPHVAITKNGVKLSWWMYKPYMNRTGLYVLTTTGKAWKGFWGVLGGFKVDRCVSVRKEERQRTENKKLDDFYLSYTKLTRKESV